MGLYTDWFIAEETEAEALGRSEEPFHQYPCLSMKGILEVELMWLWCLLEGKEEFDAKPDLLGNRLYFEGPDEEELMQEELGDEGMLVVARVAPAFLELLVELPAERYHEIAERWAQIEEFDGTMDSEDLMQTLSEIAAFAGRAKTEAKPILQRIVA